MMVDILYEDNHLLVVNKRAGDIVQGDCTGDVPLVELLKQYLKEKYAKPGEVFLGVTHRLDRPVSGVCVFARTSKALARLNAMFAARDGQLQKTYWALVPRGNCGFQPQGNNAVAFSGNTRLEHWIVRNERLNKSFAYDSPVPNGKHALLDFDVLQTFDRYMLIEVHLHTGRHHQIRCQLAKIGLPIRGDLKYGAPRSMPNGCICLHARQISFVHPVRKESVTFTAPLPDWGIATLEGF